MLEELLGSTRPKAGSGGRRDHTISVLFEGNDGRNPEMESAALARLESEISQLPRQQQLLLVERLARRLRKDRASESENERELAAMAADPAIIRENQAIAAEFSVTEANGLEDLP